MSAHGASLLWEPRAEQVASANLTRFMRSVGAADYEGLYRWSVDRREEFWASIWRFGEVIADDRAGGDPWDDILVGRDRVAPPDARRGPRWFPGARLNFADNLLRFRDDRAARVSWTGHGRQRGVAFAELAREVARVASALAEAGVGVGDRVAGFMPNLPETVVAMLAATSLGAVWSSCSPDFGATGVLDRFGQIQ